MCSRQRCGSTPTTLCTITTPGWFVWASSHSSCWSTSTLRYTKTFRPGKTGDSTQGTEKKSSSTEGCSTEAPIASVTSQLCLLFNNQAEFWWLQGREASVKKLRGSFSAAWQSMESCRVASSWMLRSSLGKWHTRKTKMNPIKMAAMLSSLLRLDSLVTVDWTFFGLFLFGSFSSTFL